MKHEDDRILAFELVQLAYMNLMIGFKLEVDLIKLQKLVDNYEEAKHHYGQIVTVCKMFTNIGDRL